VSGLTLLHSVSGAQANMGNGAVVKAGADDFVIT